VIVPRHPRRESPTATAIAAPWRATCVPLGGSHGRWGFGHLSVGFPLGNIGGDFTFMGRQTRLRTGEESYRIAVDKQN
jgi:hypothetical protein